MARNCDVSEIETFDAVAAEPEIDEIVDALLALGNSTLIRTTLKNWQSGVNVIELRISVLRDFSPYFRKIKNDTINSVK